MDKENGKGNSKGNSGSNKLSNSQDPDSILDAASLFGAYWPRGDAAANMFAGFGLPAHQSMQFGMLPPGGGGGGSGGAGRQAQAQQQGMPPAYPAATSASAAAAAAAAAAYSNAYNNTLSVAASQAASLGIPAASAAWWSMASHLAAQDYLARLQASGLAFPGLPSSSSSSSSASAAAAAADLQYSAALAAAGLPSLASGGGHHAHHLQYQPPQLGGKAKGGKGSAGGHGSALARSQNHSSSKSSPSGHPKSEHARLSDLCKTSPSLPPSRSSSISAHSPSPSHLSRYSQSVPGLSIQPASKHPDKHHQQQQYHHQQQQQQRASTRPSPNDSSYMSKGGKSGGSPGVRDSGSASPGIFNSPLSLVASGGGMEKQEGGGQTAGALSSSILSAALEGSSSDPNSILGGVRLPPDTEIIKYTSSIVGPKVPGTTNRGRKKTISLDPPSVSLHPTAGGMTERTSKRAKYNDHDLSPPSTPTTDRVEVIKLPATNGSPSSSGGLCHTPYGRDGGGAEQAGGGEAPLNLSLKPGGGAGGGGGCSASSSLTSLSNMSANIGAERISRRKPGPKPRRCIPSSHVPSPPLPPAAPTVSLPPQPPASLAQLFCGADSPRPPSRNEGSDGGSSTSSASNSNAQGGGGGGGGGSGAGMQGKEGRPRNLGRGVSKPKKNTVASLLAQSRALGIKPVPMLDPNISMNQQMNLLKSNILAAQQYLSETAGGGGGGAGGVATAADEKALNRFIQEKLRGALSDSSTVDATSDSDNLTDSNHTDSEMEAEMMTTAAAAAAKRQKHYDERLLRVPLEKGWKRETIIRGLTKSGGLRGDVTYAAPDSSNKFKQMSDVTQYLDYQKTSDLTKDHFTFSCRCIIGDYLQPVPPEMQAEGGEFVHLSEEDVIRRLEELKSAMRTSLPVEQRIEMARRQQAARAAARSDREQARMHKELERSERQEQARREREARSQQAMEAKRKRQEEMERHKHEEQQRKQQERELKRQQAAILKEQMYIQEITKQREMLYTVELERERRRQHMALVRSLESRRKLEEREKKKQQLLAEKMANKEKKLEQRRVELEILTEIRRPCEDLELDQNVLPDYERIPGLRLSGKAFSDTLMVFEFLHNFGETLGFDMDSLPTLAALQRALLPSEHSQEAEDELFSVMTHLLVCAIEDPGIPNPARYTTMLGQSLRQADITPTNISEILRIYLYANATGEVKALTGVHFERDREKRVADHHQTDDEMSVTQAGKNAMYYEVLHNNPTYKLSDLLKHKPYMSLSPTTKVEILAFICNELLQNKAVIRQIESSLESCAQQKKEKWLLDMKIRKLKMLHNRKVRTEAMEKAQVKLDGDESAVDSPSLHKDYLLDEEENEMSENESVGTQPEEEEDNKLSGEELGKKLEKLVKTSETHLQTLNTASLQLRAICFGQDRYFRRYWSLPKAGGVFVEAMESADPEEFEEQLRLDGLETSTTTTTATNGISCLNDLDEIRDGLEEIDDANDDKEVSRLVGTEEKETENNPDRSDNHATDHRKTPNRLSCFENGETVDKSEHNLAELKRSVDDIVQNLERTLEMDKEKRSSESLVNHVKEERVEEDEEEEEEETPFGSKKFNLFERLGQCMERENKSEEDLKAEVGAEVKEELKKEILNELKSEIKSELIKLEPKYEQATDASSEDAEHRWFGILPADGATCDGVHLTAGSRWENGGVGACTRDITELKIPVFPPPGANSTGNYHNSCDSPAPLQMTADESAQLEHIKKHGMPRPSEKKRVPKDKRYGWWRIIDPAHLRRVLDALQSRGARERELKRAIVGVQQSMYEGGGGNKGRLFVEPGRPDLVDLVAGEEEEEEEEGEDERGEVRMEGDAPRPDGAAEWRPGVARRVDLFLLEQVEALEDKVASASMQVKGWKIPSRDLGEIPYKQIVSVAKERLAFLELNIERRYLKPPLGINTGDPNLAAMSQESCAVSSASSVTCGAAGQSSPGGLAGTDLDVPKGLATWREAINRCSTSAQLAMCLYALEGSIAWDKSIMKANCQFCHSGDNEDKLLLCDGCDKGYHTYCFKPKMDNIPEGDWYCHECMNKATGERNCIVCGKKSSSTSAKLVPCDLCPRAYHTDCHRPPLPKSPRGKWYCSNCVGRKPHKKTPVKKNHKAAGTREGEQSGELTPSSPAPSHCSTATNEDLPPPAGGDPFNSSMANACSPSAVSTAPCPPSAAASSAAAASSSSPASASYAPSAAAALAASAAAAATASANLKKEKANHKRLMRELAPCRALLEDLECHDDAWPFLLPVNTKQFPTYKKIIKVPMDLSTIKKRLLDMQYKSRDDFCTDVRQIFNNCETFNEDDSPVGKAGHCMRQFFEQRWTELCCAQQPQPQQQQPS